MCICDTIYVYHCQINRHLNNNKQIYLSFCFGFSEGKWFRLIHYDVRGRNRIIQCKNINYASQVIFFDFFCRLHIFFQNRFFSKHSFRNTIRVSNSLYPDQAQLSVQPVLGPNFLQRSAADDKICP